MFFGSLKEYEGMKPGLSRIKKFLAKNGDPQNKFKCIHVAGSNGKGSTAAFTASMLQACGYSAALYTSPHLEDITERIKVNGQNISEREFKKISDNYIVSAQKCRLSYFEYLTAIAFIYFAAKKIDIAVIETGLGGRFDATNIIKNTLVCIITSISKEHEDILGKAIKKIAFEKAGIIKKNSAVICGQIPAEALKVIEKKAKPFVLGIDFKINNIRTDWNKKITLFDYDGLNDAMKNVEIPFLGRYQPGNAAAALSCMELLNKKGYIFNNNQLRKGLKNAKWPARFETVKINRKNKKIELVIDGAHNEESLKAFFDSWNESPYSAQKRTFIFAMMKEKDYKKAVKTVSKYAERVILPVMKSERALKNKILKKEFEKYMAAGKVLTAESAEKALEMLKNNEKAAVTGSLYLAGEILKII